MVQEMLTLVLETHCPQSFIFDGAFPYRGMLDALDTIAVPQKVWVRRGMFLKGASIPVDSIGKFDLIVHPDDALENIPSGINHGVEVLSVPPITLIDSDEMWSRESSRRRLGIPLDARVTYVQLGAGRINEIDSDVRKIVNSLLDYDDMYVVLGESLLGKRLKIDIERIIVIRDYPNALFFNAFDFSVQAGGYNSFHEMRVQRIPTLFVPNLETGMDDQLSRCRIAEDEGWGLVVSQSFDESISRLLNLEVKSSIDFPDNGADILAKKLT